jgi:hypothetical protein
MWIMTTDGFFSVVKKPGQEKEITVRSRVKTDLEKLLNKLNSEISIQEGVGTDYPFRVVMSQTDWADYLQKTAMDIEYDNFKNTLDSSDHHRHEAYFKCWSALTSLEIESI